MPYLRALQVCSRQALYKYTFTFTLPTGGSTPGRARSTDLAVRSTALAPPCAYCFASVIVWTENFKNMIPHLTALFVYFFEEKCIWWPGFLWVFWPVMTWLPRRPGAATDLTSCWVTSFCERERCWPVIWYAADAWMSLMLDIRSFPSSSSGDLALRPRPWLASSPSPWLLTPTAPRRRWSWRLVFFSFFSCFSSSAGKQRWD